MFTLGGEIVESDRVNFFANEPRLKVRESPRAVAFEIQEKRKRDEKVKVNAAGGEALIPAPDDAARVVILTRV